MKMKNYIYIYIHKYIYMNHFAIHFKVSQLVKNSPAMQETPVWFLGQKICWRRDRLPTPVFLGFPCGSSGKESACNAGDLGLISGLERSPKGGHGNPLQYSCLENPYEQRSLAGYSPWGLRVRHDWSDFTQAFLCLSSFYILVHLNLGSKFSSKFLDLYLGFIKCTVERADSHTKVVPNILKCFQWLNWVSVFKRKFKLLTTK